MLSKGETGRRLTVEGPEGERIELIEMEQLFPGEPIYLENADGERQMQVGVITQRYWVSEPEKEEASASIPEGFTVVTEEAAQAWF